MGGGQLGEITAHRVHISHTLTHFSVPKLTLPYPPFDCPAHSLTAPPTPLLPHPPHARHNDAVDPSQFDVDL